ncbi:hypothetical protein RJ639_015745 [Escallonia herrerae]|uniref:25S rRNA (uridine-N(3))-methyltransferase BMT5-like domain-containing protein n=1 Tax=Escallonia herrerae TaxID=1293975 RepID=A0AA88VEB4_9ASTE|nr:hypothetical protein RJ639_015745 [Escallonia herrerae]
MAKDKEVEHITEKEGREEKWESHYSSSHRILLVGEGDFSFSLSLALSFASASNIVATSLDSYECIGILSMASLEMQVACSKPTVKFMLVTKLQLHFPNGISRNSLFGILWSMMNVRVSIKKPTLVTNTSGDLCIGKKNFSDLPIAAGTNSILQQPMQA